MTFRLCVTGLAVASALAMTAAPVRADDPARLIVPGLDKGVLAELEAGFETCIAAELGASDWDGNGVIDATPDGGDFDEADFFADGQAHCDARLKTGLQLALTDLRIAGLQDRQAAAEQRIAAADAAIAARTQALIEGAKRQLSSNASK